MEEPTQARRRRCSAEERAKYIDLYHQSGLTQRAFAQQHGLHVGTLHYWLHRTKTISQGTSPGFQEFALPATGPSSWSAEIAFSPELTVRLGSPVSAEFIAQLVKSLRRAC